MEKQKSSTYIYEGKILKLRKDVVELSDGKCAEREVVEHPGGVGIALEDENGQFYVVRQYRYGQQIEMIEFPAGKHENGEDSLTTAKREIIEETGYEGKDFVYLGEIVPTPAYDSERIQMYYAKQGNFVGQHLDEDEDIEVFQISLETLIDMIVHGKITDSKTVAMAFLVREYKNRIV